MNKRLITLITHEYLPDRGGAGVYCEELASAANKAGHEIEVWAPRGSIQNDSFKVRHMPHKGSQDWTCSWSLLKFIKNYRPFPDLVHLGDPGVLRAFIRFHWALKTCPTLVITIHGSELLKFTRNQLEKFLFLSLLKKTSRIHVLSKHNEQVLISIFPEIFKKIVRIPGAAARRVLPLDDCLNEEVSKSPDTEISLICVGRIHPRKGQLELINAIAGLSQKSKNKLKCYFAGPIIKQTYFKKLQEAASKSCCIVEFLGDLTDEELKNKYETADIFALTSIPQPKSVEGFGFVYLEASAHGIPILAHRTGGVEDAVKDEETGFLVDSGNHSGLIEKLEILINDERLREFMGRKGRKWAMKHTWSQVSKELYEKL